MPIRELFGMAGPPRARPLGVDPGPGAGGSEGARGLPNPIKQNVFIAIQTSATCKNSVSVQDTFGQRHRGGLLCICRCRIPRTDARRCCQLEEGSMPIQGLASSEGPLRENDEGQVQDIEPGSRYVTFAWQLLLVCRCALLALTCVIGVVWAGPGPPA